jgi:Rieske Fe-S protein
MRLTDALVNRAESLCVDPDVNVPISRRTALAGGLGGAGLLALAACSGGGTGTQTSAPPTSSGPPQPLAKLDSISIGEAISAQLDGKPVIVARPTTTTAACFSAICTHQGCTVSPAGKQLQCPCHGSVYNATTGAVISGPAPRALAEIPVSVENGEVIPGT